MRGQGKGTAMHSACRASVVLVLLYVAVCSTPAAAQVSRKTFPAPARLTDSASATVSQELTGIVVDADGQPLKGAVVSALGSASAYALSDRDGRFVLRNLPAGPYVLRAHLHGYAPARGRVVQVSSGAARPVVDYAPEAGGVARRSAAGARRWRRPGRPAPGAGSRGAGPARSRRGGVAPAPFTAKRAEGSHLPGGRPMSRRRSSSRKRSSPVWAGPWKARRAWRPSCCPTWT